MAIVEQHRDRQAQRSGGQNQVEFAIAVDVAGHDLNAAGQGENRNPLATGATELEFDPVLGAGELAVAGLHRDLVRAKVAVQIVEGGAHCEAGRIVLRGEIFSRGSYGGAREDGEKEQEKRANESGRRHAAAPAVDCLEDECLMFHDCILKISID